MTEIAEGVFVHEAPVAMADETNAGDIANLGFVVGTTAVAVIDTGGSRRIGEALRAAVRVRTELPIRYVINTHMHPDHVLGNAAFAAEKPAFFGHRKLGHALVARAESYTEAARRQIGEAVAGTTIILPTRAVTAETSLDLGGRSLRLVARPTAHTDNDLTVLDEKTGTLFLGDLLFRGHLPVIDGSLEGWLAVMRDLERIPARRAVPGHGAVSTDWPGALAPQKRYLLRLRSDIRALLDSGGTISEAAKRAGRSEQGAWQLFDAFNARNAITVYHELEWE